MRSLYNVKESYTGNGSVSSYTFDFKIENLDHLLIIVADATGVETQRVRGDDITFLSSVTFDAVNGGGTVNLQANLPNNYQIVILLANDEPTQPYEFANKSSFSLKTIERALDFILGPVQRLTYLMNKSLKINELESDSFNTRLPSGLSSQAGKPIVINSTGDGFTLGPSLTGPGGIGLPSGGDTGAALTKNSATDGDASWDDFVITGYSARFNVAWSSAGLRDTLEKILQITYLGPLIASFTGSSNVLREKGDVVAAITLSVNVTKRSNDIARIRFLQGVTLIQDDNPPANVGSGITTAPYATPFSDNITFTVEVTDEATGGGPTMVTSNVSYSFVYVYYHGAAAPGQTPAQVGTMTKSVINSTATLNKTFTTVNGDVYYFAYPSAYGALTSILDENGFETFSSWTRTTQNITGLNGVPQSYYIYESNNPVVAGSTNFTFKR